MKTIGTATQIVGGVVFPALRPVSWAHMLPANNLRGSTKTIRVHQPDRFDVAADIVVAEGAGY